MGCVWGTPGCNCADEDPFDDDPFDDGGLQADEVGAMTDYTPLTQKVKGITALKALFAADHVLNIRAVINLAIFNDPALFEPIKKKIPAWMFPIFARPCPVRPRHGFVESRKCVSWEEVEQVCKETFAVEEGGEVMLCQFLNASHNMVWTPNLLTIGKGHDGATAGKDTISLPVPTDSTVNWANASELSGVGENEAPYIEAVDNSMLVLTQLRAGVPVPAGAGPNYLPSELTVEQVVRTNGEDLLAWEKRCIEEMEGKTGIVVWHPGGSITDHFSVHCRQRSIPIFTTIEPIVGETLVPIEGEPTLPAEPTFRYVRVVNEPKPDPMAVLMGVYVGEQLEIESRPDAATRAILTGLHFSALNGGEHGKWIGLAAALMCRLGSVAARGEARYWAEDTQNGWARPAVWNKFFPKSLQFHKGGLTRLAHVFRYGKWERRGYGGKNWAMCVYAIEPIFIAIGELARNPSQANVEKLVMALNVAVNQAHNNGWWLNKFTLPYTLDAIQRGQVIDVCKAAPVLYDAGHAYSSLNVEKFDKWREKTSRWPTSIIKPAVVEKVTMQFIPAIPAVEFNLTSVSPVIKANLTERMNIPVGDIGGRTLTKADLESVFAVNQDGKWRIEARNSDSPFILWEEKEAFSIAPRNMVGGKVQE